MCARLSLYWFDNLVHVILQVYVFFFFKLDLSRNCYIKNVLLLEGNSIILLPECLESC